MFSLKFGVYGVFMECSWGVQPVLGVFAFLETTNGHHGMTPQFWLIHNLDIMSNQHLLHSAVQSNNSLLRLHGLKATLPFFFTLNKQNYARYGSIYVNTLENLKKTHHGCMELLSEKGISVQG